MENFPGCSAALSALALLLAAYAAGGVQQSASQNGTHLSPTECRDLGAIRINAPPTKAQHQSELSALKKAGCNPSPWNDDPNQ
ncbi:hypothetical protein OKW34_003356 [Paraburkholderia youngii]|uniref:DUF4148 domain-containing protein n=1 Tax=Paraburkholderia youngii TaxID=2782701 RepID=UPI003D1CD618